MSGAYPKHAIATLFVALVLAGCAGRPARETPASAEPAPSTAATPAAQASLPREGRAFRVVPEDSLLTIQVYRGGALSKAGHNHVIASRALNGMAWVPDNISRASFEVRVPVAEFTIDEPGLRALAGPDFSADVPDSAREGTKKNMLSEPMLDGARFPEILLRSAGPMESGSEGVLTQVSVTVRDQARTLAVPLRYQLEGNALRVQGELSLKQTDLGLTPFSLFGGALRVEDEMRVKFSVVARGE